MDWVRPPEITTRLDQASNSKAFAEFQHQEMNPSTDMTLPAYGYRPWTGPPQEMTSGGRRPLLREGAPISYQPTPSPSFGGVSSYLPSGPWHYAS